MTSFSVVISRFKDKESVSLFTVSIKFTLLADFHVEQIQIKVQPKVVQESSPLLV